MKVSILTALGAGAAALFAATSAEAQRAWRTVGVKTVDAGVDTDRIHVRGDERVRQIRLCVFNAPLVMRDFDVRFDNGGRQDVRVRQRIRPGTCTRNIDLAGRRRDIETIRLTYSPIRRGWARPLVRVQVR